MLFSDEIMSWSGESRRHMLALNGVSTGRRTSQIAFFQSRGFKPKWIQQNCFPSKNYLPSYRQNYHHVGWTNNSFRHSLSARGISNSPTRYVPSYTRRYPTYYRLPTQKISVDITENSRVAIGLRKGLPYGQAQVDLTEKTTATYEANLTEGHKVELTHQPTKNTEVSIGVTTNTGPYVEASAKIGPVQIGAQINKEGQIKATIKSNTE
jgi:hypothetical protein